MTVDIVVWFILGWMSGSTLQLVVAFVYELLQERSNKGARAEGRYYRWTASS